jgi:RNA polymerase sigma-70 factor (ECF subfamily)
VIAAEAQYRDWMLKGLMGDSAAYRMLLKALAAHLRAFFARRVGGAAAEDLVQETLIALHSKRETYDPSLPFTAWVYGIARYKLIDEYRREKRRATVPLDQAPELFTETELEAAGARHDVEKLLAKLPDGKRALLKAVKLDGLTIAEAAAKTGMSETAVKVSVHRALKALGNEIGGDEDR